MANKPTRLDLFDLLKGVLILMMVGLHYLYLASELLYIDASIIHSTAYLLVSRFVAGSFVILSTAVLWYRSSQTESSSLWFHKLAKQLVKLGLAALLVSLVTYLAMEESFVRFGILHLLTVATLINGMLFRLKIPRFWYGVFGVIAIIVGNWLLRQQLGINHWEWLGVVPDNFTSIDYVPILPWIGVTWLAVVVAPALIGLARDTQSKIGSSWEPFIWCGRHTLAIYLLHIPAAMTVVLLLENFL